MFICAKLACIHTTCTRKICIYMATKSTLLESMQFNRHWMTALDYSVGRSFALIRRRCSGSTRFPYKVDGNIDRPSVGPPAVYIIIAAQLCAKKSFPTKCPNVCVARVCPSIRFHPDKAFAPKDISIHLGATCNFCCCSVYVGIIRTSTNGRHFHNPSKLQQSPSKCCRRIDGCEHDHQGKSELIAGFFRVSNGASRILCMFNMPCWTFRISCIEAFRPKFLSCQYQFCATAAGVLYLPFDGILIEFLLFSHFS